MTESERIALPLIEKLIVYRDTLKSRDDRELLADACNTLSSLRATCTTLRARLALLESVLAEAGEALERVDRMAGNVVYNLAQMKRGMTFEETSSLCDDLRALAASVSNQIAGMKEKTDEA